MLKLTFLIQHCSGDSKKLMKVCVLLPTEIAYVTALSKLEKRFGQSHLIARSYIDDKTGGPVLKANDVNDLVSLTVDSIVTWMPVELFKALLGVCQVTFKPSGSRKCLSSWSTIMNPTFKF